MDCEDVKGGIHQQDEEEDQDVMIPVTTLTKISDYVDRYFLRFYRTYSGEDGSCLNQYAFQHTNKLCLVGLSSEHDLITKKKTVVRVSYDKVFSGDMQNMVKGKKKKGGIKSNPTKTIGEIFCSDGTCYEIKGVIEGSIIELNDNLISNPSWLTEFPDGRGFIGIINIGKKTKLSSKRELLNRDQYQRVLSGEDIEVIQKENADKIELEQQQQAKSGETIQLDQASQIVEDEQLE